MKRLTLMLMIYLEFCVFTFSVVEAAQAQWMEDGSEPIVEWGQLEERSDTLKAPEEIADDLLPAASLNYDSYLRVAGSALKPRESDVEWTGIGGGGCIYASSGSSFAIFNLPVTLPQGAIVQYLRMYYNDTSDINSTAWFTVYNLYGEIVEEWEVSSSGSAGYSFTTTDEFTHTIDYGIYSYAINWRPNVLGSVMQVCGFRIYYKAPTLKVEKIEIGPF